MSHSPSSVSLSAELDDYTARWRVLVGLMRQGRSFSGRERNCCFLNTGSRRFADVSSVSGLDFSEDTRAVLPVDWDFDGDLDVWLLGRTAPRIRFLRNGIRGDHHYLAVRLRGQSGNRDAIGARVELRIDGLSGPLARTLRAGEGFVSQSSKWMHFGLGPHTRVRRLIVRWPDGNVQHYDDVPADRYLLLTQGRSQPDTWRPPDDLAPLAPSKQQPAVPADGVRMTIAGRVPAPRLDVRAPDGRVASIDFSRSRATLVHPWATWCAPCITELREFAGAADELETADVRVFAINMDGLRDHAAAGPGAVEELLQTLGFTQNNGYATDALLDKLDALRSPLVESNAAFSLPSSYLFTGEGELAAVYRGPVTVEQLLSDVEQLLSDVETLAADDGHSAVGPSSAGKWFEEPSYVDYVAQLGVEMLKLGYFVDAGRFLASAAGQSPEDESLRQSLAEARNHLQNADRAIELYTAAARQRPSDAHAHAQLGVAHQIRGNFDLAVHHLAQAVQLAPESAAPRRALGAVHAVRGEYELAARQFRRVLEIVPGDQRATSSLERLQRNRAGNSGSAPKE